MARHSTHITRIFRFSADTVFRALRDYSDTRVAILSDEFKDFTVIAGGLGGDSLVSYRLEVEGMPAKDLHLAVEEEPAEQRTLIENDPTGNFHITWTVQPQGQGFAQAQATVTWETKGLRTLVAHKTTVSRNIKRAYASMLRNLDWHLRRRLY